MATRAPTATGASTLAETVSPSLLLRVLAMPMVRIVILVPAGIVTGAPATARRRAPRAREAAPAGMLTPRD